jgi:hypothetical protein
MIFLIIFRPKIKYVKEDDAFLDLMMKTIFGNIKKKFAFFVGEGYHAHVNMTYGRSLSKMKGEELLLPTSFLLRRR